MFEFTFSGGIWKPTTQSTEKFLMYFVLGGDEVSLHQMKREGLVTPTNDPYKYRTSAPVAKVFMGEEGFGMGKRFHSFYMRFVEPPAAVVTIKPFSILDDQKNRQGMTLPFNNAAEFEFTGSVSFLKRAEVIEMLSDGCPSKRFVSRQKALSVDVIKKLITVDKSELRKGIRHIKIGRKK